MEAHDLIKSGRGRGVMNVKNTAVIIKSLSSFRFDLVLQFRGYKEGGL